MTEKKETPADEQLIPKEKIADFGKTIKQSLNKLRFYLSELETLEIITAVGDATEFQMFKSEEFVTQSGEYIDTKKAFRTELTLKANKVAYSRLHVFSADATTVFHEAFMDEKYDFLREYHLKQSEKSHEMLLANIAAIGELISLFSRDDHKFEDPTK